MEDWQTYISAVIFTLVSIFIFRKILIEKLNDVLDLFGLPIIDFSKEENKVYEPIYFKSITPLRHYCEPHQSSTFENGRTKTATEVMFEHREREQEIINNFKYEKENNKMTKKQLKGSIKHLYSRLNFKDVEIQHLRKELNRIQGYQTIQFETKPELFIATQEEIEKAKCCETCTTFKPGYYMEACSCENKIISSYAGVDIEETKCKEHKFNEKKLIKKIKEMRADKEHTERVKEAKPTIVKFQEEK